MWMLQRCGLGLMAVLIVLCGPSMAMGQVWPDCSRFTDLNASMLPQGAYLPPLIEDASYSITSPGHLGEAHLVALRELLDRARCIALSRRIPLGALRITVFAHTDERGAREHILDELRRRGVAASQLNAVGRSIVDVVAAWHRARVVVERVREEVSRDLRADPSLGSIDPTGMVQPSDLTSSEPKPAVPLLGGPPQAHRRSFVVLVAAREDLPAHLLSTVPLPAQPTPVNLPPTIQVSCCTACGSSASPGEAATGSPPAAKTPVQPWLGQPQLDALIGTAVATDSYTRTYLYRELAWLALNLRLPLRRLELAARLSFHAGGGGVTFNNIEQVQLRLGTGLALQLGVLALDFDRLRLALGAEVGWVYLFRRIERSDFPYVGLADTKHIQAPQASGWLRLSTPLPGVPRLALSIEVSVGVIPFPTEEQASVNVTAKALGGITYALR